MTVAAGGNITPDDGSGGVQQQQVSIPKPKRRTQSPIDIEEHTIKIELVLTDGEKKRNKMERRRYIMWRILGKPFRWTSVPKNASAPDTKTKLKPNPKPKRARVELEVYSSRKQQQQHFTRYKEKVKKRKAHDAKKRKAHGVTAFNQANAVTQVNATTEINEVKSVKAATEVSEAKSANAATVANDPVDDAQDDKTEAKTEADDDDETCETCSTYNFTVATEDDVSAETDTFSHFTASSAREKPGSPREQEPSEKKQEQKEAENNEVIELMSTKLVGDAFDTLRVGFADIFLCQFVPELFDLE